MAWRWSNDWRLRGWGVWRWIWPSHLWRVWRGRRHVPGKVRSYGSLREWRFSWRKEENVSKKAWEDDQEKGNKTRTIFALQETEDEHGSNEASRKGTSYETGDEATNDGKHGTNATNAAPRYETQNEATNDGPYGTNGTNEAPWYDVWYDETNDGPHGTINGKDGTPTRKDGQNDASPQNDDPWRGNWSNDVLSQS